MATSADAEKAPRLFIFQHVLSDTAVNTLIQTWLKILSPGCKTGIILKVFKYVLCVAS